MLCQFTVKNYKSIRDEMTFDMQAAAISEHEDKVIRDKNGEQFLPVLQYMVQMVVENQMSWKHCILWQQKCYARCMQQEITRNVFFFRKNY